ncbi:MAG: ATP-binding protein [Waddliaceae bacterium]
MKRDLEDKLIEWKDHPLRKPLILRGARQVGKSWLAQRLGETFDCFVEINFDLEDEAKKLFYEDLDTTILLEKIGLYKKKIITPGKTLLFLDEIQECEQALRALRYFKEQLPELHVIAAGSLLDFAIEKIGIPVGRVQYMYVHPLNFGEFLDIMEFGMWRKELKLGHFHESLHRKLLEQIKHYLWIGGMPEVIKTWRDYKSGELCQQIQDEIIATYQDDFRKYASKHQIEHVEKVFNAIPMLTGGKFKYANIDRETRSYQLKNALMLLEKAGIAHICYHSSGQGMPMAATRNEQRFKVFLFDVGLAQRLLKLDLAEWLTSSLETKHLGAMAEQYVAQEYIALTSYSSSYELFYWHREKKGSSSEVDFLFRKNGVIFPVEVKSGGKGKFKSLFIFLETHKNSPYGIKISEAGYEKNENFLSIPFYMIESFMA